MATTNTRYVDVDAAAGGNGTTNALSGGNCAYKSLSIWEAARQADLPTGDIIEACICESSDGAHTADTTAVTISGWITDATRYISITTSAGARHAGIYSASKYRLEVTDASCVSLGEDCIRLNGLQIKTVSPTANGRLAIGVTGIGAGGDLRLSNSLLVGHAHGTHTQAGLISLADTDVVWTMWNVIAYNVAALAGNRVIAITGATTTAIYGCTLIGGEYTIRTGSGTTTMKNTYCGGSLTEDYIRSAGTLVKVNCASDDASADDTSGADETQSNCVVNILYDTTEGAGHAGFTNVGAGTENFTLKAGSDLVGRGATLTDDPPGATALALDIAGNARS